MGIIPALHNLFRVQTISEGIISQSSDRISNRHIDNRL